eukprot:scaffold102322_cov64-Cyclotella_meneghiniana.AAC.1
MAMPILVPALTALAFHTLLPLAIQTAAMDGLAMRLRSITVTVGVDSCSPNVSDNRAATVGFCHLYYPSQPHFLMLLHLPQRLLGCWSCECMFDDPSMTTPPGPYNPPHNTFVNRPGTGPIARTEIGSVLGLSVTCYKWSEYTSRAPTAAPIIMSSPTKAPVTASPTKAP